MDGDDEYDRSKVFKLLEFVALPFSLCFFK